MIIEYAVNETKKPKTVQKNSQNVELALNIVSNCCCCVEGRTLVNKVSVINDSHSYQIGKQFLICIILHFNRQLRMLHAIDALHPHVTRNQKPWQNVTVLWLKFFEVLTRYEDSSKET